VKLINKILLIVVGVILIALISYIVILQVRLGKVDEADLDGWKKKYEAAQQILDKTEDQRDSIQEQGREIQETLDQLTILYSEVSSTSFEDIKSKKYEKINSIRRADSTELERHLSDRLDKIRNNRSKNR